MVVFLMKPLTACGNESFRRASRSALSSHSVENVSPSDSPTMFSTPILGAFGLFAIWRTFSSPTAARGEGAGRALIEALVTLGREHGWRRVYWHTHENNEHARTLYDRLAKRTDYVRYDIEF